ncbi:hypothetical protein [Mucilaginibacter sp.]|uniref:PulJ/GspJ family protein n=1 Tax=Mucilaginibacter sp. TaxID=1882438 RepID=UPI0032667920
MTKHQLKAFTIMEVTITMLLAAILIGITYATYNIISKSYISFSRKNDDMQVFLQLDKLLRKDFAHSGIILKTEEGLFMTDTNGTISYQITPDYTLRTQIRTDTFKVSTQQMTGSFEGAATSTDSLVDDLSITVFYQGEKIPYHYHKQYSSADLVKRNTDALN